MNIIRKTAVLGTGTIGASWAAQFLAAGLDVSAHDPAPDAAAKLRRFVDAAWPALTELGLAAGADRGRLSFNADAAEAVRGAEFVQENGPERLEVKRALFAAIESTLPTDAIVASSSSALMPSAMQEGMRHPERMLLAHPFNPPHLIPLVEVCGGRATTPEAVDRAMAFYTSIGKHPIRLKKEMPGHVSNRLQAAIWREVAHLVAEGVVDVADVDAAISKGPGLRWALMGAVETFDLAGGAGGRRCLMEHIDMTNVVWPDLGSPVLGPELRETLAAGADAMAAGRPLEERAAVRDRKLLAVLRAVR